MVVIVPGVPTLRIRLLFVSAMYKIARTVDDYAGWRIEGRVGGRAVVSAVTLSIIAGYGGYNSGGINLGITLLRASAIYTLPALSMATPVGRLSSALVAGPLSPL